VSSNSPGRVGGFSVQIGLTKKVSQKQCFCKCVHVPLVVISCLQFYCQPHLSSFSISASSRFTESCVLWMHVKSGLI